MNPGDALYANLARLSYSASLRAQVSTQEHSHELFFGREIQTSIFIFLIGCPASSRVALDRG